MTDRRPLAYGVCLTIFLAGCAAAGSNGSATPPVTASTDALAAGHPSSLTQTVWLGLAQNITFAPAGSGESVAVNFPATLVGEGPATVTFQSTLPAGAPPLKSDLKALAFVVVKPSSDLTFAATPGFIGTFPAGTLSNYTYVAIYNPANARLGWTLVAGPVPANGKNVALPSSLQEPPMSLGARKACVYAIVERSSILATPSPGPGTITEYAIPGSDGTTYVDHMTRGPDGNLWFVDTNGTVSASIDKFTTAGAIVRYHLKWPPYDDPKSIVTGTDGNMWFTETDLSKIAKMTTNGVLTEYPMTTIGSAPWIITPGPDGNMWFTEPDFSVNGGAAYGAIGKITTNGVVTDYPLPAEAGYASSPFYITTGPDGNLWFTLSTSTTRIGIGKITTSGVYTLYPLRRKNVEPYGIVSGPGGKLWFTEVAGGRIGTITTSGVNTDYDGGGATSVLQEIVVGSDGNLWFADAASRIDRMTPQGVLTQFPTPTQPSGPASLVSGPDGNIWFTEAVAAQIGKVIIAKKTHAKGASHD
jgi:streptogramin lyase